MSSMSKTAQEKGGKGNLPMLFSVSVKQSKTKTKQSYIIKLAFIRCCYRIVFVGITILFFFCGHPQGSTHRCVPNIYL